jgi:uncharacterized protein YybS (DUF2232 family)
MENKKYNTKSIVEAGLISAIIVVLMLITGYVPMVSFMGTLILPVPVALLFIRHDIKVTIAAIVVSALITATLFNPIQALMSAISFGLTGLTLGYCIKKDKSSNYTLLLLAVVSLVANILTYALTIFLIQNTTITVFITRTIDELNLVFKDVRAMYSNIGMTEEQLKQVDAMMAIFNTDFLINALTAFLILQAAFSAFLNYVTAKAILRRLGYVMKSMTPFTKLYINSLAGALIVMPVPLGVYLKAKNLPLGAPILTSGTLLMQYAFLMIGISVAAYFLKNRFRLSNGVITLIIIFISFNPVFSSMLLYLGIADMIIDFRKINPNRILKR